MTKGVRPLSAHTPERDQLWIIPSRGRPTKLLFLLRQALRLAEARTDFAVCHDTDDTASPGYALAKRRLDAEWPGRVIWSAGPRYPVTELVNRMALATPAYPKVGFMGDDHWPQKSREGPAWDAQLGTCLDGGAPFAYGDDLHQGPNLPTFFLARRDVVQALGWLALPRLAHYFFDDACLRLGAVYCPAVVVEHKHHIWGGSAHDVTYADAEPNYPADEAVFRAWCDDPGGLAADRQTVAAALTAGAAA